MGSPRPRQRARIVGSGLGEKPWCSGSRERELLRAEVRGEGGVTHSKGRDGEEISLLSLYVYAGRGKCPYAQDGGGARERPEAGWTRHEGGALRSRMPGARQRNHRQGKSARIQVDDESLSALALQ